MGYRILASNYKAGGGELDIVALRKGVLVFAEVKTRSSDSFGTPAESVGEKKIACLRAAAAAFIYEQCRNGRVTVFLLFAIKVKMRYKHTRNDIIEVFLKRNDFKPYKINHIEDAF
ncbi:MAG: endonuclease [Firmicutes bacterium HGW-Firmicutes-21]|nr:MAG: endonuclease [Firmicutes bacterium HGW-Firmicutes-21]